MKAIICSAGRVAVLNRETLPMLERGGLTAELHIVVPEAEVETYRSALRTTIPFQLHGCEKGLTRQRQFARSLFAPTDRLVFFDDDVQRLRELDGGQLYDVRNLDALLAWWFQEMDVAGAALWSVYPVANKLWQSDQIQSGVYCVGAMYGIRNDIPPEPIEDDKEDKERQLAIMAAGGRCIRFCKWGIQTRYWRGDTGGIQRTDAATEALVTRVVAQYPTLVCRHLKRNGRLDLKFLGRPQRLPAPQTPPPVRPVIPVGLEPAA